MSHKRRQAVEDYLDALGIELEGADPVKRARHAGVAFVTDTIGVAAERGVKGAGRIVREKLGGVLQDILKRGPVAVLKDINEKLDMQYQRGVERNRRRR